MLMFVIIRLTVTLLVMLQVIVRIDISVRYRIGRVDIDFFDTLSCPVFVLEA